MLSVKNALIKRMVTWSMTWIYELLILAGLIHYSLEACRNAARCIANGDYPCDHVDYVVECTDVENYKEIKNSYGNPNYLYISKSNIYEIQPGSLRYFSNLYQLWMPDNNITVLEPGSFNGLINLNRLTITNNNIETIYKGVFSGMYGLSFLDLSHNQIQTIESNSFTGMDSLNILNLNNNQISNMTALTDHCKNLELLDLSNNRLEELQFTKSCTKMRNLNVASNSLSTFCGSELSSSITSLDLSNNNISYIRRIDLENLNNLLNLNLSRNPLFEERDMPVDLLQDRNLLNTLNLSSTSIKKLSVGTFSQMESLKVLDLSSNSLTYLPNSIFHELKSLKELYLGANQLSHFYYDGSMLSKLDLNGNFWNCDSLSSIIKKLTVQDFLRGNSYNTTNIYGIACYENIEGFEKMETYNSSGISDLQKVYLSQLTKTQTDLRETFAQIKDILNETSIHLQGLGNSMRQQRFDEEDLLGNLTNAMRSLPQLVNILTILKNATYFKEVFDANNINVVKQLIIEIFGEENPLANHTSALESLPKLVNELVSLKNETIFRGAIEANNDNTIKQLIMELKTIILSLNSNFLSNKADGSSPKSLQTMQNESLKADPSTATNKSDTVALYFIAVVLVAILCLLIVKQRQMYKRSRIAPDESNPLNSLVV